MKILWKKLHVCYVKEFKCHYLLDIPTILFFISGAKSNQSVENTGVAFVKGADERNKLFKKINNQ